MNEVWTWALQLPTKCLRNGGVTCLFKVLSSFNAWSRGTVKRFKVPPLRKHNRCGQSGRPPELGDMIRVKIMKKALSTLLIILTAFQISIYGQTLKKCSFVIYEEVINELKSSKNLIQLKNKYDYMFILLLDSTN